MKRHLLYLTVRIEVDSWLDSLSNTLREFEQDTEYGFSDTENVKVTEWRFWKPCLLTLILTRHEVV